MTRIPFEDARDARELGMTAGMRVRETETGRIGIIADICKLPLFVRIEWDDHGNDIIRAASDMEGI